MTNTIIDTHAYSEFRLFGARCLIHLASFSAGVKYQLHFRNCGNRNVEGIFSFALGTTKSQVHKIRIRHENGQWMESKIVSAKKAADTYERQIEKGKTPVTVDRNNSDVTINIGTLLPDEKVDVQIELAVLMDINSGVASLRIPTSIVPRYGNPADNGHEPISAPHTNVLEEQSFDVLVKLDGGFDGSDVECTYPLQGTYDSGHISIIEDNWLNAPFNEREKYGKVIILCSDEKGLISNKEVQFNKTFELKLSNFKSNCWASVVDDPLNKDKSIACLNYYMDGMAQTKKRRFHVLVDCSGSMSGSGEQIVKETLNYLAKNLNDNADIGLSCFGSEYREIFPIGENNSHMLADSIESLPVGEMGGTELELALEKLLRNKKEKNADIFLLTDGAVYGEEGIVNKLRLQNKRIFCIGIGSGPNESLVREIAEATGGKFGFTSENRKDIIRTVDDFVNNLAREQLQIKDIYWPYRTVWESDMPLIVHDQTVAHAFAFFDVPKERVVKKFVELKIDKMDESKPIIVEVPLFVSQGIAKTAIVTTAAMARYQTIEQRKNRKAFALKYQLFTDETSFLLKNIRTDGKSVQSQGVSTATSMLPEGSHGIGLMKELVSGVHGKPRLVSDNVFYLKDAKYSHKKKSISYEYTDDLQGLPFRSPANFISIYHNYVGDFVNSELFNACSITMQDFLTMCIKHLGIPDDKLLKIIYNITVRKLSKELEELGHESEELTEIYVDTDGIPKQILYLLNNGFKAMTVTRWNFLHNRPDK